MAYQLFSFNNPQMASAPQAAQQMQQLSGIDPGHSQLYDNSGVGDAARQALAKALSQNSQGNGLTDQQAQASQMALAQGAQNGSVGPTVQNAQLMQSMMPQQSAQPNWFQRNFEGQS